MENPITRIRNYANDYVKASVRAEREEFLLAFAARQENR